MKVFITSGGTNVPIDDVRHIGNMSSGRYGAELANQFSRNKHDVYFFHAKNSKKPEELQFNMENGNTVRSEMVTFNEFWDYRDGPVNAREYKPDVIISAAAVSDWVTEKQVGKIPSDAEELTLKLTRAPKILPHFKSTCPKAIVIGFKLLIAPKYQDVHKAVQKVLNNGADYVVYNDLAEIKKGDSTRLIFDKNMNFTVLPATKDFVNFVEKIYGNTDS